MNAAELARISYERYGEYPAIHFEGATITNVEHAAYAGRLGAVLQSFGAAPGERVLVLMPNGPEVLACFQAIWRIGAVISPVTPQLGPREIAYMMDHSGAVALVTLPEFADRVVEAAALATHKPHLLVIGDAPTPHTRSIDAAIASASDTDGICPRDADDLAVLLYTSGTTGHPKGVMLTHENIVSNHRAVAELKRLDERGTTILALPLSHSFGVLMMNLCSIFACSAAVLRKFDPAAMCEAIERYRVTRFAVVPTMMVYMNQFTGREKYELSSMTCINSGGAILPNEVRLAFERNYNCRVIEGYGLSECAPTATAFHGDEIMRAGSIGRAVPGVTVSIVDNDGNELPPGETGEICIKGPNVMKGYWKNEAATADALRDGWLHSGDVGRIDDEGYVYITDRLKDLIIKGGENISPREIEEGLYEHPAVAEAQIVGVPDATFGETIWAVVALNDGAEATEGELLAHLKGYVTRFKLPSRIVFRPALPKNANGKLDRKALRAELREQAASYTA